MKTLTIQFDGGCQPNPGQMYGSYAIMLDGSEVFSTTEDYGYGTNNVAEFTALHRALLKAVDLVALMQLGAKHCTVNILTDSTIIRNRLNGAYRAKGKQAKTPGALSMGEWTTRCQELLWRFASHDVKWQSRENNVERFGH